MGSTTIVRSVPAHGIPPDTPPPEAILEQLGRILASPLFRSSKHYPRLLKYVVEQTLAGHAASLKERSLGMEVFGRDPHYDTNADPVVRTSACEVRKRIAQYYHDPAHESEIRIELPAGCYVPEFHMPELRMVDIAAPPPPAPALPAPIAEPPARSFLARHVVALSAVAVAAVGLTAAGLVLGAHRSKTALDQFWGPVWERTDSVLVCLGVYHGITPGDSTPPANPTHNQVMWSDRVAFADAVTMAKLTGLLQGHGKQYDIRPSSSLTLADLHQKPALLIGAFNNPWTMALNHELRYSFQYEDGSLTGPGRPVIRDARNPGRILWRGDFQKPYADVTEDYAIVSRYLDRQTERMVVSVAGIGKDGTAAAGEFVTGARYLNKLAASAPPDWARKNLQVVLATEIINGNAGPPRVLATYFW